MLTYVYRWNKELFPDHVAFLEELKDRGLKVSLNTHPADGIRPFEDCYGRICEALGRDPSTKDVSDNLCRRYNGVDLMTPALKMV